jgi:predicted NBD/HSP70 family sugar kinase
VEENLSRKHRVVLQAFRRHGPLTRAEAAALTGLSRSGVHLLTSDLLAAGLIHEVEVRADGSRGRPASSFAYSGRGGHVLGISFEHDGFSVAIADLSGRIIDERTETGDVDNDPEGALRAAASAARELLAPAAGGPREALAAVASLAGPIDARYGTIRSFSVLRGWSDAHPAQQLGAVLGVPTLVDNDANLAAFAEATSGAGVGCDDLLYVKASTGVGAGLILGGQIYRGAAGMAGELGHVTIEPAGKICRCGSKGCLETVVGTGGIVSALAETHGHAVTIEELIELAGSSDAAAERALADAGTALGRAIGEVSNVLNPALVIIGGELAAAGDLLLEPLRRSLRQAAMQVIGRTLEVRAGVLGPKAELIGAAALAAELAHEDEPAAAVTASAA